MSALRFRPYLILVAFAALISTGADASMDGQFDSETAAQIARLATPEYQKVQRSQKVNERCDFTGKVSGQEIKLTITSLTQQKITGKAKFGSEPESFLSFEQSGESQSVQVFTWWNGFFGTRTIRLYLLPLEADHYSITAEVKDGWYAAKVRVSSVCYFDSTEEEVPVDLLPEDSIDSDQLGIN